VNEGLEVPGTTAEEGHRLALVRDQSLDLVHLPQVALVRAAGRQAPQSSNHPGRRAPCPRARRGSRAAAARYTPRSSQCRRRPQSGSFRCPPLDDTSKRPKELSHAGVPASPARQVSDVDLAWPQAGPLVATDYGVLRLARLTVGPHDPPVCEPHTRLHVQESRSSPRASNCPVGMTPETLVRGAVAKDHDQILPLARGSGDLVRSRG
jgi:hypothetical protein